MRNENDHMEILQKMAKEIAEGEIDAKSDVEEIAK